MLSFLGNPFMAKSIKVAKTRTMYSTNLGVVRFILVNFLMLSSIALLIIKRKGHTNSNCASKLFNRRLKKIGKA